MVKIPKRFKLFGKNVTVHLVNDLAKTLDICGTVNKRASSITLQTPGKTGIPAEYIKETYIHELVHLILLVQGEEKLATNEKFVEVFASLLYQALSTAEHK